MFDIPLTTIRFWEGKLPMLSPKRVNGVRKYTPKDIENFKVVYHLIKDKGLKISAVGKYMSTKPMDSISASAEVVERLEKLKARFQQVLYFLEDRDNSDDETFDNDKN